MLSISKSFSRPILALLSIVILLAFSSAMLPTPGSAQQGKERVVRIKIARDQPVEIVAVKVKGIPVEPHGRLMAESD